MSIYLDRPKIAFSDEGWVVYTIDREHAGYSSAQCAIVAEVDFGNLTVRVDERLLVVSRGALEGSESAAHVARRIRSGLRLMGVAVYE